MDFYAYIIIAVLFALVIILRSKFKILQVIMFVIYFVTIIVFIKDGDIMQILGPYYLIFLPAWVFGSLIALAMNNNDVHKDLYHELNNRIK